MGVEKVQTVQYKISDGSLHPNFAAATRAEAQLMLDELISNCVPYSDGKAAVSHFLDDPTVRKALPTLLHNLDFVGEGG